jgi:hypothetical protein
MKNKVILGVLSLALASSAQAAVAVPNINVGTNYLLAGWDFDAITTWSQANSGARYSDIYGDASSVSRQTAGIMRFDGTVGSDSWSTSQLPRSSTGQISQQLDTRGPTPATDYIGALGTGEGSISILPASINEATRDSFVFKVFNGTTPTGTLGAGFGGFTNLYVDFQARVNGADSTVLDPYTFNWSYSTDGINFITAATASNLIDTSVNNTFSGYTASITGLNAIADVPSFDAFYVKLDVTQGGPSQSRAVNFDNVAIYGTAAAIPEPSTYAAILGALSLGFVAIRRRFQAKVA